MMSSNETNKVLWWIIACLTSLSFGAGANYITRLDRLTTVEIQIRELDRKVDWLIDRDQKRHP